MITNRGQFIDAQWRIEAMQLKLVVSPLPMPEGYGELVGDDKLQRLSQRRRLHYAEVFLKTVLSAFPGGGCFFKLLPADSGQGDQAIAAIFRIGTNFYQAIALQRLSNVGECATGPPQRPRSIIDHSPGASPCP